MASILLTPRVMHANRKATFPAWSDKAIPSQVLSAASHSRDFVAYVPCSHSSAQGLPKSRYTDILWLSIDAVRPYRLSSCPWIREGLY